MIILAISWASIISQIESQYQLCLFFVFSFRENISAHTLLKSQSFFIQFSSLPVGQFNQFELKASWTCSGYHLSLGGCCPGWSLNKWCEGIDWYSMNLFASGALQSTVQPHIHTNEEQRTQYNSLPCFMEEITLYAWWALKLDSLSFCAANF